MHHYPKNVSVASPLGLEKRALTKGIYDFEPPNVSDMDKGYKTEIHGRRHTPISNSATE